MSPVTRDARDVVSELFNERSEEEKNNAYVCTIVSLLPIELTEEKPHLFPAVFIIPAAEKDDLTVTYIGESHHFIPDAFDERRNFKQITPPHEMARSICEDYNTAHIGTTNTAGPGLFWVHGRKTKADILKDHKKILAENRRKQTEWFNNLIAMADADWEKNHNRLAVSDLQRIAAQQMGIQKDWVASAIIENMTCPFCKAMIAKDSVKCFNCKEIVNVEAYKALTQGVA